MFNKIGEIVLCIIFFGLIALFYIVIGVWGISIVADHGKLIGLSVTVILFCLPTMFLYQMITIIKETR